MRARLVRLAEAWKSDVQDAGNEPRLLSAVAFLLTFAAARVVTHSLLSRSGGGGLEIGPLHVHHVVFGLVLLLVAGWLDLAQRFLRTRAIVFGIGSALVLDEFALVLNLADVYWKPEGRESIDAVVIFASALWILVLGGGFWRRAWRALVRVEQAAARRV